MALLLQEGAIVGSGRHGSDGKVAQVLLLFLGCFVATSFHRWKSGFWINYKIISSMLLSGLITDTAVGAK
jgi:hypothetical protein